MWWVGLTLIVAGILFAAGLGVRHRRPFDAGAMSDEWVAHHQVDEAPHGL